MDKLIITAACDSRVSYPINHYCLPSIRENARAIAEEYVRCLNAGASIAHLHGVRRLEAAIQEDGKKLSRVDVDGWREMTDAIRAGTDGIIQFGIAGARLEDRLPLMQLHPDMMSVAFNAHDEYFQPNPEYPPNAIYSLHPLDELREYGRLCARYGIKIEVETFHTGAIWNMSVMSPTRHWSLLAMAIGMGGHVRVGYEDNPYITPNELADSNARLVEKIVEIARHLGREIATPEDARQIIGLPVTVR